MPPRPRQLAALALALTLAGCQGAPGLTRATAVKQPVQALASPLALPQPLALSSQVVSLSGVVTAPAGIVSNNGGGLITDGGSGLITDGGSGIVSNHGAGFHTLALAQVPVAGRVVTLLDAAGHAVMGRNGKPMSATTDARGRYAFVDPLPGHNLLLRVELPGGGLAAIAPRGGVAADIDLVSTLTSRYILTRYVGAQADPVAVLEKLPPDVEATTRARTAAALARPEAKAPERLGDAQLTAAVDALRKQDPALDAQLEVVKQLLVAAGLSDLGNGLAGSQVTLSDVVSMVAGPEGSVYLAAQNDNRIWRLAADGKLYTAVGNGTPSAASVEGLRGEAAGIAAPLEVVTDAQGRLIVLENPIVSASNAQGSGYQSRITRLEADGRLTQLWASTGRDARVVAPGRDGRIYFMLGDGGSLEDPPPPELWAVGNDAVPVKVHTFTGKEALMLRFISNYCPGGLDSRGRMLVNSLDLGDAPPQTGDTPLPGSVGVVAIDLQTFAVTTLFSQDPGELASLVVTSDGQVLHMDRSTRLLQRIEPTGEKTTLCTLPAEVPGDFLEAAVVLADGRAHLALNDGVYAFDRGKFTLEVGGKQAAGAVDALSASLDGLSGLAGAPDGSLYVLAHKQLLHLGMDKKLTPVAGGGSVDTREATRPLDANLYAPEGLRVDAQGHPYFLDTLSAHVWRLDAQGRLTEVPGLPAETTFNDFLIAPDGTCYWTCANPALQDSLGTSAPAQPLDGLVVQRRTPNGTIETLTTAVNEASLALDPKGALVIVGEEAGVRRWTPALGVVTVFSPPELALGAGFAGTSGQLAFDAAGRLYVPISETNRIYQLDLVKHTTKIVAGSGGTHFAGTGVDQGVLNPQHLTFTPNGDLYFADVGHKQVKRIPAREL